MLSSPSCHGSSTQKGETVQTPTLHQAHAAFDDHDAFLYAVLGVASTMRRVTELVPLGGRGAPREGSVERNAGISDGPVLDALLGLVALKTNAEKILGDMTSAVESTKGRKAPRVRRSVRPKGGDRKRGRSVRPKGSDRKRDRSRHGGLLR